LRGVAASSVEALVVGAGPSGLFAALELARHGVTARVVEREPQPHHQARATALQPASLEILATAGVLDSVLVSSVHVKCVRMFDPDLRIVRDMPFAGIGTPWEFQCSLPQWRTEQILTERFVELGGLSSMAWLSQLRRSARTECSSHWSSATGRTKWSTRSG